MALRIPVDFIKDVISSILLFAFFFGLCKLFFVFGSSDAGDLNREKEHQVPARIEKRGNAVKRRDLIKTIAIGAIPVAVCVPENPDILGYKFDKKVRHNDKLCRQYKKEFISDGNGKMILDTESGHEYLLIYKSLEPVKMTSVILVDDNGVIESRPNSISRGQKLLCEYCNDPTRKKVINT